MKSMKHRDLLKKLKKLGVEKVREGKGSHTIYQRGDKQASIPAHKIVSPGSLRDIYRNLGLSDKEIVA